MKISGLFLSIILFGALLNSCSNDELSGFEKGENGVNYQVHYTSSDTVHPKLNDWVTLNMDYRLDDTILFSSSNLEKPLKFSMIEPMFQGDLYDGLKIMGVGDSMTFAVVADSFYFKTAFAKKLPEFVTPGSLLYYDVKLTQLQTDEEFKLDMEAQKESMLVEEKDLLANYVEENNITIKPLESGLYFIPIEKGNGLTPVAGDMCSLFLEVKRIDGTTLFSNFGGTPLDVEYGKNFDTKGFMEGLGLLSVGGRANLIVPSEIGVGETGKETVPGFTTILYDIELLDIKTVEQVKRERRARKAALEAEKDRMKEVEPAKMQAYIKKNNITQQPTATGLYVIIEEEGTGSKPIAGEKVKLHYIVTKTDGRLIFDSRTNGEPVEFVLGQGVVVKAWDEGLTYVNRGSKVRMVSPSKLAYGRNGQGDFISPYEVLVYDIELYDEE